MKILITHTSDTHGNFPPLRGRGEVIVHSGDFMPNRHGHLIDHTTKVPMRGAPDREEEFQTEWVDTNLPRIKEWINKRSFIFCKGNHDYIDPTPAMRAAGIDAINITDKPYHYNGVPFIGFPYCPYDVRPWNYAVDTQTMNTNVSRIEAMIRTLGREVVLVAHCPPANVFDYARGMRYGNTVLADLLFHGPQQNPIALLCGHIHQDHGITYEAGMLISQAATTVHNIVLTVEDD